MTYVIKTSFDKDKILLADTFGNTTVSRASTQVDKQFKSKIRMLIYMS